MDSLRNIPRLPFTTIGVDKILKYVTLIGFLLVGIGLTKSFIYYKAFKVRILYFIDFNEVLISFADNLIPYFLFLLSILVFYPIIYRHLLKGVKWYSLKVHWLIIVVIILFFIYDIFRENINQNETIIVIAGIVVFHSIFVLLLKTFDKIKNLLSLSQLILIISFIFFLIYSVGSAFNEIHKVKKLNYFKGSEFMIDGIAKTSSKTYFYIGQSKKYIFFYDSVNKSSDVFPISDVQKFTFKH